MINIFCKVFSELELGPEFPCCLWHAKHQLTTVISLILENCMLRGGIVIYCIWSQGVSCYKMRHALSPMSKQLVPQTFPCKCLAYAYTFTWLAASWKVTEIANMVESNGTNLQSVSQIFCFSQAFENQEVLVLQLDSWCEREVLNVVGEHTSIPIIPVTFIVIISITFFFSSLFLNKLS